VVISNIQLVGCMTWHMHLANCTISMLHRHYSSTSTPYHRWPS